MLKNFYSNTQEGLFHLRIFNTLFNSAFEELKKLETRENRENRKRNNKENTSKKASSVFLNKKSCGSNLVFLQNEILNNLCEVMFKINASFSIIVCAFVYIDKLMIKNPEVFSYYTIEK